MDMFEHVHHVNTPRAHRGRAELPVIPAVFAFGRHALRADLGAYWLFVLKPEQTSGDTLHRRLKARPRRSEAARPRSCASETQDAQLAAPRWMACCIVRSA